MQGEECNKCGATIYMVWDQEGREDEAIEARKSALDEAQGAWGVVEFLMSAPRARYLIVSGDSQVEWV